MGTESGEVSGRFASLCSSLDQLELQYRRDDAERAATLAFQRAPGRMDAVFRSHANGVVELSLIWPFLVPRSALVPVGQAVLMVNLALQIGRLDVDPVANRILFRVFHAEVDQPISLAQLRLLIGAGVALFDMLCLPMQDVCLRGGPPELPLLALQKAATS